MELYDALVNAGAEVRWHKEVYPGQGDLPDTVWLPDMGRWGWTVLTRDQMMMKRPLERLAIQTSNVGIFLFSGKGFTGEMLAEIFLKTLPMIENLAMNTPRPFVFQITTLGKINRKEL